MEYIIPACGGGRIDVTAGQTITVIDVEGGQVVDFFAKVEGNPSEFLSTGATIDCNNRCGSGSAIRFTPICTDRC